MSPNATIASPRVTKADAKRRTGLDLHRINQLIEEGVLVTVKLPFKVRACILESSLDALVEQLNGNASRLAS